MEREREREEEEREGQRIVYHLNIPNAVVDGENQEIYCIVSSLYLYLHNIFCS